MSLVTQSETKLCGLCNLEKPAKGFSGKRCRDCRSAIEREYYASNPEAAQRRRNSVRKWHTSNPELSYERYRKAHLKHRFNLSIEEYSEMLDSQNGVCAICAKPETLVHHLSNKVMPLAVDHDHTTGAVRGLLCRDCNQNIGKFGDDAEMLLKAYEYLMSHKSEEIS